MSQLHQTSRSCGIESGNTFLCVSHCPLTFILVLCSSLNEIYGHLIPCCGGENGNPLQYSCLGKSHRQRNLVGYSPWGHKRVGLNWATEIQPVHSKEDQSWVFFGRNDAKAETPVLWPPHVKSWLIGKDSDAGRDWGQEEKGTTEDEMAGWHHWLNGHESQWTPMVGDGQGGLECCDSWGCKESDTTEQLNWTVV